MTICQHCGTPIVEIAHRENNDDGTIKTAYTTWTHDIGPSNLGAGGRVIRTACDNSARTNATPAPEQPAPKPKRNTSKTKPIPEAPTAVGPDDKDTSTSTTRRLKDNPQA